MKWEINDEITLLKSPQKDHRVIFRVPKIGEILIIIECYSKSVVLKGHFGSLEQFPITYELSYEELDKYFINISKRNEKIENILGK